jgi:hypothetical protein
MNRYSCTSDGVERENKLLLVARFCSNTIAFSEVFDDSLDAEYQLNILISVRIELGDDNVSTKTHG